MSVQNKTVELSRLLSLSQRPLYAFIRAQVRTSTDAEDVYQQTAVVLCEEFDAYNPARPFIAWACGIAWHRVLSHYRNASRLKFLAGEALGSVLADKYASSAAQVDPRREKLQDCLAQLKPESREIIERHYYKEEDVQCIATDLGVSDSCIYKTLARIRRVLLDCIERKLKEDC
jgi:RNA polymerase sigma-70 factor (ECF subfamily)